MAAIMRGLSGLLHELARLPLRECWIPWTIDVWRWWPYGVALPGSMIRSRMPGRWAAEWSLVGDAVEEIGDGPSSDELREWDEAII